MITLLHGDDTRSSRTELLRLKNEAGTKELRFLDGKTLTDADLVQALSSSSLFGGGDMVIIENLFSGLGKKLKRMEALGALIQHHGQERDVIVWENKEVGKTATSVLGKNTTVRLYKHPTILFQFLDAFRPTGDASLLLLYQRLVEAEPPELVHALLVKRALQLLAIHSGTPPKTLTPWQVSRLTNQSRAWTMERLTRVYYDLRHLEYKRNSGTALFDLKEGTELVLLDLKV